MSGTSVGSTSAMGGQWRLVQHTQADELRARPALGQKPVVEAARRSPRAARPRPRPAAAPARHRAARAALPCRVGTGSGMPQRFPGASVVGRQLVVPERNAIGLHHGHGQPHRQPRAQMRRIMSQVSGSLRWASGRNRCSQRHSATGKCRNSCSQSCWLRCATSARAGRRGGPGRRGEGGFRQVGIHEQMQPARGIKSTGRHKRHRRATIHGRYTFVRKAPALATSF